VGHWETCTHVDSLLLPPCSVLQIYMMTINDPRFETGIHFDDGQLHAKLPASTLFPPPFPHCTCPVPCVCVCFRRFGQW
jgi:hypothetical protein